MSTRVQNKAFEARDPNFEARVRESFERQIVMQTIGASLESVKPGEVLIGLPFREDLTQQHGFLHAGIIATIVDSACGYAALSLTPANTGVLTIEYKVNLTAPARGTHFTATGRVIKPGRTICFTEGEVWGSDGDRPKLVATISASIMVMADRSDIKG
ncbi:MAG: hypothetical protein ACI8TQ_001157 [Planctomycetota bacterium]|jgi:uncharacterized protein (TIGR00369 family)